MVHSNNHAELDVGVGKSQFVLVYGLCTRFISDCNSPKTKLLPANNKTLDILFMTNGPFLQAHECICETDR
jgi:hypothetical protein